jgi:hypothetical protein
MTFASTDHVTEREAGKWTDCTVASFLEILRLALPNGRSIPTTIVEVHRFRAAAGPLPTEGTTIPDLIPAAKTLYGLTDAMYTLTTDWAVAKEAILDPCAVAVVQGLMGAVSSLCRWDDFTGAHAVAKHDSLVWCDPLAPAGVGYTGEIVGIGTWQAFFSGLPGARALIMRASGGQGMIAAGGITITSSKQARVSVVTPILKEPGGEAIANAQPGYIYPYVGNVTGYRAIVVNTPKPYPDGVTRPTILYVAAAAVTIEDAPKPATSVDTGPAVSAKWESWIAARPKP